MGLFDIQIPNAAADVVGVFDQNFSQVFPNARAMKAEIRENSKIMEHPVETGITITDHRIIKPIVISLYVIIGGAELRSIYAQIKEYFVNATLLTVQTRTSNYENMLIEELPHEETAEMQDSVAVMIRLREVQFVQAQFGTLPAKQVAKPANASTVDRGQVNPLPDNLILGQKGTTSATAAASQWQWNPLPHTILGQGGA